MKNFQDRKQQQNMDKSQSSQDSDILDQAVADIDDQQLSITDKKETYDANKLRNTLKMIDTNTVYDEQRLEDNFGGNLLKSIEHDVPNV